MACLFDSESDTQLTFIQFVAMLPTASSLTAFSFAPFHFSLLQYSIFLVQDPIPSVAIRLVVVNACSEAQTFTPFPLIWQKLKY